MTALAKIEANRRNGQLSTGPRTPEGKAVVARNATKHGIFAAAPVVPGECPDVWESHRSGVVESLAPVGLLEVNLAERAALLLWRLQLYQSYLNIGLLADARAEGLYEAAEVAQLLGSVVAPLEKVEKQLEKVAALRSLTDDDRAAVARMRKVAGLLRQQGTSLQAFWETGVADHGKKYEEARQAAWAELSDLLELAPKKGVAPEPAEKP